MNRPAPSVLLVSIPALVGILAVGVSLSQSRQRRGNVFYKKRRTVLPAFDAPSTSPALEDAFVPNPSAYVLWFNEVSKRASAWVGGKGANLGEMASAGFPVPPGFCITRGAFDLHMSTAASGTGIGGLLRRIEDGQLTAAQAHAAVLECAMPAEVEAQITKAYSVLGDGNALVAVRSSATAEDSADASFAGQLDTFLGVRGLADVLRAVKECWASLYSERVDAYRKLAGKGRGGAGSSIACCVVVQTMLDADVAGVMFTANPFNQSLDEIVVTANWGLGESVVADIASPDTWVVRASDGALVSEAISV